MVHGVGFYIVKLLFERAKQNLTPFSKICQSGGELLRHFVSNQKLYYNVTMNIKKIITLFLFCLILPLPSRAQTEIDPNFNPNKIIEDNDLLDYDAMSLPDIQNFLQSKNSFLANYITTNAHGTSKSAAIIMIATALL
jgi:hypothetical protein